MLASRVHLMSYTFAAIVGLLFALVTVLPASAHETGPPSDCGFDHACSYKDAHYGNKIWSPSGTGSVCHNDFSLISGLNDELSSVYNHATNKFYQLFEHRNQGGFWVVFSNNAFLAHLSEFGFNDEASSCRWRTTPP